MTARRRRDRRPRARPPLITGECPACHRASTPVRRDGTLGMHKLSAAVESHCPGSGKLPLPFDPNKCGACMEHRFETPGLAEAASSVGIEHGRNLMWDFLETYHKNGHKDPE